jgi:hypothetical protein
MRGRERNRERKREREKERRREKKGGEERSREGREGGQRGRESWGLKPEHALLPLVSTFSCMIHGNPLAYNLYKIYAP